MLNKIKYKKNKTNKNTCYKKYCNKIITKKQLTKKLIKQFNNFQKGKNNKEEKRKNLDLILQSNKCMYDNCKVKSKK